MSRTIRQAALGVATLLASIGYVSTCVSQATAETSAAPPALSYAVPSDCEGADTFVLAAARAGSGVLAPQTRAVRVPLAARRAEGFEGECNYSPWCERNSPDSCVNKKGYCSQCCYTKRPITRRLFLR